jgi:AcrR family transcriptional regulator
MATVNKKKRAKLGEMKRARTRAMLIEVALRVIADKGFDVPTIDNFIAAADVARGTFYNYFKTREDILSAAAAYVVDTVDEEILPLFQGVEDPAGRIAIAIQKFIEMSKRRPDWGGLLMRMIPVVGGALSDEMRRGVVYDLTTGQKSGQFHFPSIQAAVALSMGTITLAIRAAVTESIPENFAEMITIMVLQGLGMPSSEAKRIAVMPLPVAASGSKPTPRKRTAKRVLKTPMSRTRR